MNPLKRGTFYIVRSLFAGDPALVMEIQAQVLIAEAMPGQWPDTVAFSGWCDAWDEIDPSERPPVYNIIVTLHEDGSRTWEWKRYLPAPLHC
jgi:hypothetical protein